MAAFDLASTGKPVVPTSAQAGCAGTCPRFGRVRPVTDNGRLGIGALDRQALNPRARERRVDVPRRLCFFALGRFAGRLAESPFWHFSDAPCLAAALSTLVRVSGATS